MDESQKKRRTGYGQSPDPHQPQIVRGKVIPTSRPVHAAAFDGAIKNGDPEKHYIKANPGESDPYNVDHFMAEGYEVEKHSKGGVGIVAGSPYKLGEPIMWRGMILMSCTKKRHDEIYNYGPTGMTGQAYQDKIMLRIKQGQLDKRINVRGMHQHENFELLDDPEVFR